MPLDPRIAEKARKRRERRGIQTDMGRILAIPLVDAVKTAERDAAKYTRMLRRFTKSPPLRPIQGATLATLARSMQSDTPGKGVLGPIGVGWGKTGIAELAGEVASREAGRRLRTLLMVPAELREKTLRDRLWWRQHYDYHPPMLITHHKLSSPASSTLLERIAPELVIIDEAHAFRHAKTSRTKRLLRYAIAHPETRFVLLSGSMTGKGLDDYAHLAELALRGDTPIPLSDHVREVWGAVIDTQGEADMDAYRALNPLVSWWQGVDSTAEDRIDAADRKTKRKGRPPTPRETMDAAKSVYRMAFSHRLRTTPGVVATSDASASCSLVLSTLRLKPSPAMRGALERLSQRWETPNGEPIVDQLSFRRAAAQLSCGFFRRFVWPNDQPDHEWLDARRAWGSALSKYLEHYGRAGLDSPALVIKAITAGRVDSGLAGTYHAWKLVEDRYGPTGPPSETVWVDKRWLVDTTKQWVSSQDRRGEGSGIVWYGDSASSIAVGERLRQAGFRVHGAGSRQPQPPKKGAHWSQRFPACSIRVHGTGKNLQAFSNQLVLQPPAAGQTWEQLLGRMHRPGQHSDEVRCDVLQHTWFAQANLVGALRDARYIEDSQNMRQKLNLATWK